MNLLLEKLLGLDRGFLSREGEFSVAFNPQWPWQAATGAALWNVLILALGVALVVYVYRREGRARGVRISLAAVRLALIGLVLVLLNRPVLTLTQSRTEPSVLAVMIDNSLSMRIKDIGNAGSPEARIAAVRTLLGGNDARVLKAMGAVHGLKLYRFDADAAAVEQGAIAAIAADGQKTQVTAALRSVLRDSQGQRLAGVVVLSDGRDMPQGSIAAAIDEVKDFGVPIFPVPVGSDRAMRNIELQQVSAQDSVFVNDVANIKTTLRLKGPAAEPVTVRLVDKASGAVLNDAAGRAIEVTVTPAGDAPTEVELQLTPTKTGPLDLVVEAAVLPGEIDEEDNRRTIQMSVLDA
ncbi:MAG TPA: hypothetical protein VF624_17185, partial [Tepidisphaeraceae bacterium]